MSKLTPPSKNNLTKRLKFFLANLDYPNAKWEIFNLQNLIIARDYEQRKIHRWQFLFNLKLLDITQGLREPTAEEKTIAFKELKESGV